MTIASEITRLQGAKADIKTAIEAKGVSIPSSDTIDCYACCIDSIPSGTRGTYVDVFIVGGGGDGGNGTNMGTCPGGGGGGGAGGVIQKNINLGDSKYGEIKVGIGGGTVSSCRDSAAFGLTAYGGGTGGNSGVGGYGGGSGGGGGYAYGCCTYYRAGGITCFTAEQFGEGGYNGNSGGAYSCVYTRCITAGGGGGGAGGAGCENNCYDRSKGGMGICSSFSGTATQYAGGGGGGGGNGSACGEGQYGGGDGGVMCNCGCNATTYGSGGGGGGKMCCGGHGCQGIVMVRYKTDGSYGIDPNCAFGGCKYTCGDYTIHCYDAVGKYFFSTNGCEIKQPGIYHNQSCGLITLSTDGVNWTTIKDKNIGATSTNFNNCSSYGYTFAWGNNYGFCGNELNENSQIDASTYGPNNYYCCNKWRCGNLDWSSVRNTNLWGYDTGTKEAMRGPSTEGFHVPTCTEFINLSCALKCINGGNISANAFKEYLFMPTTQGYSRHDCTVARAYIGTDGGYWTSTPRTSTGYECNAFYARLICIDAGCNLIWNWGRAVGYSIREFKNTPEIPTIEGWDKLL